MLGRVLADAGAALTLAYVRHTTQSERSREELEEHEAEALLERGARWLGDVDVERRVVVSASTGEGLKWLAEQEEADIVVFGSDYRTAAGHVAPQRSAQTLLEGGPAAVAIAPANYRVGPRRRGSARSACSPLPVTMPRSRPRASSPSASGATLTRDERRVDLLVVGSRSEAPEGRVMITAQAQNEIENATVPGARRRPRRPAPLRRLAGLAA